MKYDPEKLGSYILCRCTCRRGGISIEARQAGCVVENVEPKIMLMTPVGM
jgi:hypothetical protein